MDFSGGPIQELPSEQESRLRVLIVDDEPMLRSVIEEFLAMLGFDQPVMAGDGRQALEVLRSQPFDCMISDIKMPEMTLEELLEKSGHEFPHLIVIATSGYSDFDNALNIIDKGAHDFLGKPLNLDSLETAIGWVLQRRPILQLAREFFSIPTVDSGTAARLDKLSAALDLDQCPFRENLRHARRVGALARRVKGLTDAESANLVVCALLHEIGSSTVMQSLCDQPRRLEDPELSLIRAHARISGRLVGNNLGRPDFQQIIADHCRWGSDHLELQDDWDEPTRLSNWLGLLNYVDGCLRDRPDRMAYRPQQVHESLGRRHKATGLRAIEALLTQWAVVEAHYAK